MRRLLDEHTHCCRCSGCDSEPSDSTTRCWRECDRYHECERDCERESECVRECARGCDRGCERECDCDRDYDERECGRGRGHAVHGVDMHMVGGAEDRVHSAHSGVPPPARVRPNLKFMRSQFGQAKVRKFTYA